MRVLDGARTAGLLPYTALAAEIGVALADHRAGRLRVPERTVVELSGGGKLLVMPAADEETAITKLVTVHPGNTAAGLPTIQGEVVVMRASDGQRIALLEGATVTARRTAALSLLAAQRLAPSPGGPLLVFGAGAQARSHIEAFREGLDTSRVYIRSRTPSRARELAEHARSLGLSAEVIDDAEAVRDEVKLIVTATDSREPLIGGALESDQLVCAVGAFRPDMAELAPDLIGAASVVVDTLPAALEEAGDLIAAAASGRWDWNRAVELASVHDVADGDRPGPVVFKSVGHALFDLAAARLARRALGD